MTVVVSKLKTIQNAKYFTEAKQKSTHLS